MSRRLVVLAALLCSVLAAPAADAQPPAEQPTPQPQPAPQPAQPQPVTPSAQLADANQAFQSRDYGKAIPLLTYLLYPEIRFGRKWETVEARVLLGVAHFETGDSANARRELEAALLLDNQLSLDSITFSPEAIEFFETLKAELLERIERDRKALDDARANDRLREYVDKLIVIERRPFFINFVPLGAGQFQNGHTYKGLFFAASEVGTCSASAALWVVQVARYGLNGRVPEEDVGEVRRLQQFQIAAGAACLVLVGAGIVDALLNYQSETRLPADESLLPADLRRRLRKRGKQPGSSVHLQPTLGPTGAGVAVLWEF